MLLFLEVWIYFCGFSVPLSTVSEFPMMEFLKHLQFYQQFYCQSNHQFFLLFLKLLFWGSFKCICKRLFSMIKKFLTVFTTYVFTCNFADTFAHIFSQKKEKKSITFYKHLISRLTWIASHFYMLRFIW